MSEVNSTNKKNKELDPNNKERNLQEYNSVYDRESESQNEQNQSKKQTEHEHVHDDSCSCGQ
jgi:hypothetical protein